MPSKAVYLQGSLLDRLRLNHGMYWKGKFPPIIRPLWFVFVSILLALVAHFSNLNMLSLAQAEERISTLTDYEKLFLDCLNGTLRLSYDNHTGKGYGKTFLICRIEEIPV